MRVSTEKVIAGFYDKNFNPSNNWIHGRFENQRTKLRPDKSENRCALYFIDMFPILAPLKEVINDAHQIP